MNSTPLGLAAGLLLCTTSLAFAGDTYVLEGHHDPLGQITTTLEVSDPNPDGVVGITLRTLFHDQAFKHQVVLRSSGKRHRQSLLAKPLSMATGAMGRLQGIDSLPDSSTSATLTFNANGTVTAFVIDAAGHSTATSAPAQSDDWSDDFEEWKDDEWDVEEEEADRDSDDDDSLRGKIQQKGKHLIAIAKEKLEELSYDGVRLNETFKVHDYFHVGVGGKIRVVDPEKWTEEQQFSAQGMRRPIWLANEVEGGVRIPLTANVDLGEVSLKLGFVPSAKVTYEVTDLYEKPEGLRDDVILDDLRSMAKHTFTLPLDAGEALDMTPGAVRVMDGEGTVAISGFFQYGRDVTDMGDVVRIGAATRIGGFYKLQGRMRIAATRLRGDFVRVRVTRGTTKTREASADLLIGAVVDEGAARDEIGSSSVFVKPIVKEVADVIEDVLSIEIDARRTRTIEDEVDISFLFDLSKRQAREAYDKAIRGDLTRAAEFAQQTDSGVLEEFRVLDLEDRTYVGAELKLSKLARAGASRTTSIEELVIEYADGPTTYDIFRYEKERHGNLGSRDRKRGVSIEVIRETDSAGAFKRSLRYEFTLVDPSTTRGDADRFRRLMRGLGLDDSIDARKDRKLISRYHKTRTSFVVTIGERGLKEILAASNESAFDAYVVAYQIVTGRRPGWATANGRRTRNIDNSERSELRNAQTFVKNLQGLNPSASAEDRAESLEKIARAAGYRQIAIAAFIQLAPAPTVSVKANMAGDRLTITDGVFGAQAIHVDVDDPR